ncbi:NAC domain-containing protein 30-like [Coffea eugenioides]|uniref:NAC domain-containing protein 30-like n=1 Tax=Coffea eugenioides TaxID=49369 RepID=UPI000F60ED82|nr:NAC domain-containing protein 30-like [Coffea eugenioides]
MDRDCPIGFRFRPTEEEIITLLWLKASNQQKHTTDVVPEKILYGADASPWKLFRDDDVRWQLCDDSGKKHTKRMAYVFTKLSKMSANRTARTAGCGTWEGQAKAQDIPNSRGEIIGSRKMLSYVLNSGSPQGGGWIMHEYSLAGSLLDRIGPTDYVVCRITIDDEKYTEVKKVTEAKQGVNQSGSMRCTKNPKVLGKRSEPSFVQQRSNPSKMPRSGVVEEETSGNAAANLAMGASTDGTIETPNSLNNHERFVINPQAIMSHKLFGMDGQTSDRDASLRVLNP